MSDILRLDRVMTLAERREVFKSPPAASRSHPAPVGSGPAGETCGSCQHLHRVQCSKTYLKWGPIYVLDLT